MNASGYKAYKNRMDESTFQESTTANNPLAKDVMITAENLRVEDHLKGLYTYLLENGFIEPIRSYSVENMNIFSRFVIEKIEKGDDSWRDLVPLPVAEYIDRHNLWSVKNSKDS